MQKQCLSLFLVAIAIAAPIAQSSEASVAVVVAKTSKTSSLNIEDVRRIYLGKPTAEALIPVDLAMESAARQEFLEKVLLKNEKQLTAYWSVQVFTGKGTPPQTVGNEVEAKRWLASNPGGIAYIDAKAVDDSVRVVLKVP